MLFDAHLHLIDDNGNLETDTLTYFNEADKEVVKFLFNNSTSLESNFKNYELAKQYDFIIPGFGLYPLEFRNNEDLLKVQKFREFLVNKVVPDFKKRFFIGEIGLDYKYGKSAKDFQKKAFKEMLSLAKELDVFVEVHSRWAINSVFDCIEEIGHRKVVMHWFLFEKYSKKAIENGFYITVGPWYLLNRKKYKAIIEELDENKILFETDFPVKYNGVSNRSFILRKVFEAICEDLGINMKKFEKIQEKNFKTLLNIY